MRLKTKFLGLIALLATVSVLLPASAAIDDGQISKTRAMLKGKKVGFVPISMGFDLPQAWYAGLKRDADRFGYELIVREANWNVQTGAQAINQLIGEKVDLLVIQPTEMLAYAKLVDRANAAGITVVQINLKSPNTGDAYVGADWNGIFTTQAEEMTKLCSRDKGRSGKVAFLQGVLTTSGSQIGSAALKDYFATRKDMEVVADQAADWDSSKARAVAGTILKQHPDLCGFMGFWEVQDMGTAAAIKEAGLQGKVYLITSGGGEQKSSCANVANGNFTMDVTYDARGQARDLSAVVLALLQNKPNPAGSHPIGVYSAVKLITKENAGSACWNLEDVKRDGP
jgi:ABC-type sugar transport system substrate-binding protein